MFAPLSPLAICGRQYGTFAGTSSCCGVVHMLRSFPTIYTGPEISGCGPDLGAFPDSDKLKPRKHFGSGFKL